MGTNEVLILMTTAALVGVAHTLLGPDHYLPFIALARARRWTNSKALRITILCGICHVLSSVLIGTAGLMFGIAVLRLEIFEAVRGNVAGWLLFGFGLAYTAWGLRYAFRKKLPQPSDANANAADTSTTPWILFIIFVFGPCEPLIPIFMYPAANASLMGVVAVTSVFCLFTVGTMVTIVYASLKGFAVLPKRIRLGNYAHAAAGFTILLCSAGMQIFGL